MTSTGHRLDALGRFLRDLNACSDAVEWIRACDAPSVETCPRGEWLLWLGLKLGVERATLRAAVRPSVMRSLRVHAPSALEAAGLRDEAEALRALPDDVEMRSAGKQAARRILLSPEPLIPKDDARALAAQLGALELYP